MFIGVSDAIEEQVRGADRGGRLRGHVCISVFRAQAGVEGDRARADPSVFLCRYRSRPLGGCRPATSQRGRRRRGSGPRRTASQRWPLHGGVSFSMHGPGGSIRSARSHGNGIMAICCWKPADNQSRKGCRARYFRGGKTACRRHVVQKRSAVGTAAAKPTREEAASRPAQGRRRRRSGADTLRDTATAPAGPTPTGARRHGPEHCRDGGRAPHI